MVETCYNLPMRFTKMQGAGNDYIYLNGFEEKVSRPADVARRVSDRHFGIGSDGLILIQPPLSSGADCRMEMYNADGSRAQMCGNGIRCVAKYVYDRGLVKKPEIRVETDAGLKMLRVSTGPDGRVHQVEVNMGAPKLARAAVPFQDGGHPDEPAIDVPLEAAGRSFRVTAVSMGNPHVVVSLDHQAAPLPPLAELPLPEWGPQFENHAFFPERVNIEFITFWSRNELDFRVWERGSGETLACGTGACAAVVAGVLNDWCNREAVVHLRGGDLRIRWEEGKDVYMTGPAVEVFSGDWEPTL
jgi:diaminopimelate epimerase